jgi:transcriptional regulator with XRE-family HTH domain
MDFQVFKQKLLGLVKPDGVEYTNEDLPYQISYMLRKARLIKGLTQRELAQKIGTKQESIARAENGNLLPSLTFLKKIADAYNSKLVIPMFDFLANDSDLDFYNLRNTSTITVDVALSPSEPDYYDKSEKIYPNFKSTRSKNNSINSYSQKFLPTFYLT